MTTIKEELLPTRLNRVRDVVASAGIDTRSWLEDRHGQPIENNIYRNFQWSFGGGGEPVALCIWHEEIDWSSDPPARRGNTRQQEADLSELSNKATSLGVKSRLGIKVRRTRDFQNALYEARKRLIPVRVILLAGERASIEDAANGSSSVMARELDPLPWYVHNFDPMSGDYELVRGTPAPIQQIPDPFAGIKDPALDSRFQDLLSGLEDTEKDALIKARVGQGNFRDALEKRWGGCSVTGCRSSEILVASHIKPWRLCETPAERLGTANGLLLTPNLDKLFDRGFITFDESFRVRVSTHLKDGIALVLHVDRNLKLRSQGAGEDLKPFLAWHSENIFLR